MATVNKREIPKNLNVRNIKIVSNYIILSISNVNVNKQLSDTKTDKN